MAVSTAPVFPCPQCVRSAVLPGGHAISPPTAITGSPVVAAEAAEIALTPGTGITTAAGTSKAAATSSTASGTAALRGRHREERLAASPRILWFFISSSPAITTTDLRRRSSLRWVAGGRAGAVGVVVDEFSRLSALREGGSQEEGEYERRGAGWPAQARHRGVAEAAAAVTGPDAQGGSDVFSLVI